jgi:hypothetical protein
MGRLCSAMGVGPECDCDLYLPQEQREAPLELSDGVASLICRNLDRRSRVRLCKRSTVYSKAGFPIPRFVSPGFSADEPRHARSLSGLAGSFRRRLDNDRGEARTKQESNRGAGFFGKKDSPAPVAVRGQRARRRVAEGVSRAVERRFRRLATDDAHGKADQDRGEGPATAMQSPLPTA